MIGQAATWTREQREAFAGQFVGLPWKFRGADWDGVDCFGLLFFFFRRAGVILSFPDYEEGTGDDPRERVIPLAEQFGFRRLDAGDPEEWGDAVILRNIGGGANHIAVVIDGKRLLHARKKTGVVITPYGERLIAGFYRHMSRR